MAIAGIYRQTIRFRWRSLLIGVVSLGALLFFGMAVYRGLDPTLYDSLPEAFRSIVGIPPGADVASLAYSAIYNSYGALVMGGLGIAAGTAVIAGDEQRGLLSVLLANRCSRSAVFWTKTVAVLTLLVGAGALLWAAAAVAPAILDVQVTGLFLGGFTVHLMAITIFFTMLALAVGGWTGRPALAAGVATAVLVASFLAVGLLPWVSGAEELARLFPWYYFNSSDPLHTGKDIGHVAILLVASSGLAVIAWWGFLRRDLRMISTEGLIPRLARVLGARLPTSRLAATPRISHIWVMTLSARRGLLALVVVAMVLIMGVLMGPIYRSLDSVLANLGAGFPDELLAFFGGGDLTTPEGYFRVESLGMVAPIAVMVATITIGASSVAGEESRRTIGLLLSTQLSRRRLLLENSVAMVVAGMIVGAATGIGIIAANLVSGLGMSYANIAATSLLLTLLGLVFGAIAVFIGAATGSVRAAVFGAAGLALVMHVVNAMAVIADASWAYVSPFAFYLGNDPMVNGLNLRDAMVLLLLSIVLIGVSVLVYQRRDLRQ